MAEAADETTITYDITFHGYDAAVDVAADIERAQGVAGSASAGVAVSEAIIDAAEVINAVTDIVDEVNSIVTEDLAEEEAQRLADAAAADEEEEGGGVDGDAGTEGVGGVSGGIGGAGGAGGSALGTARTVSAQSGPSSSSASMTRPPKIIAAHNKAEPFRNLAGATRTTSKGKIPNRQQATAPLRVSAQGTGGTRVRAQSGRNFTGGAAAGPGAAPGPEASRTGPVGFGEYGDEGAGRGGGGAYVSIHTTTF